MTTKSKQVFNPLKSVYTPPEVSSYGLAAIKSVKGRSRRALALGIPGMDNYFAPVMPGELAAVIAQTSNYKSGFLHAIEKAAALQIEREERDEILIHVSVEEVVEQQAFYLLARESGDDAGKLARGDVQDWDKLNRAAIRVGTIPIFRIGESLARSEDFPYLSISNMIRSIMALSDGRVTGHKMTIGGLFFDYLQAFPIDNEIAEKGQLEHQRRLQVREDIYRLRQAAAYFQCPVWVAVQAKQILSGVNRGGIAMPGIYDGEESSSIAQRVDRAVMLCMPKMSNTIGSFIQLGDKQVQVTDNLILIKAGKQRGGLPSGKTWQCRINFADGTIAPELQ